MINERSILLNKIGINSDKIFTGHLKNLSKIYQTDNRKEEELNRKNCDTNKMYNKKDDISIPNNLVNLKNNDNFNVHEFRKKISNRCDRNLSKFIKLKSNIVCNKNDSPLKKPLETITSTNNLKKAYSFDNFINKKHKNFFIESKTNSMSHYYNLFQSTKIKNIIKKDESKFSKKFLKKNVSPNSTDITSNKDSLTKIYSSVSSNLIKKDKISLNKTNSEYNRCIERSSIDLNKRNLKKKSNLQPSSFDSMNNNISYDTVYSESKGCNIIKNSKSLQYQTISNDKSNDENVLGKFNYENININKCKSHDESSVANAISFIDTSSNVFFKNNETKQKQKQITSSIIDKFLINCPKKMSTFLDEYKFKEKKNSDNESNNLNVPINLKFKNINKISWPNNCGVNENNKLENDDQKLVILENSNLNTNLNCNYLIEDKIFKYEENRVDNFKNKDKTGINYGNVNRINCFPVNYYLNKNKEIIKKSDENFNMNELERYTANTERKEINTNKINKRINSLNNNLISKHFNNNILSYIKFNKMLLNNGNHNSNYNNNSNLEIKLSDKKSSEYYYNLDSSQNNKQISKNSKISDKLTSFNEMVIYETSKLQKNARKMHNYFDRHHYNSFNNIDYTERKIFTNKIKQNKFKFVTSPKISKNITEKKFEEMENNSISKLNSSSNYITRNTDNKLYGKEYDKFKTIKNSNMLDKFLTTNINNSEKKVNKNKLNGVNNDFQIKDDKKIENYTDRKVTKNSNSLNINNFQKIINNNLFYINSNTTCKESNFTTYIKDVNGIKDKNIKTECKNIVDLENHKMSTNYKQEINKNIGKKFKLKINSIDYIDSNNENIDSFFKQSILTNSTLNENILDKSLILQYKKTIPQFDFIKHKTSASIVKSEDECSLSGDEKTQITSVPMFNNKKLENYIFSSSQKKTTKIFNPKKIVNDLFMKENFIFLLKNSPEAKELILSYLNYKDISHLSLVCTEIRSLVKYKINTYIIKLIFNDKNIFLTKLCKSIYKYSNLSKIKYLKKEYLDHLYRKSKYEEDIKKDLNRTFPEEASFKQGQINHKKLFNILLSYSNYNQIIGYAQGLNFVVGNAIFIIKEEEEIFMFIDSLINKLDFQKLIGLNNTMLKKKLDEIGGLLNIYTPEIINYLEKYMLNHEFFTTNWIITIFSNSVKRNHVFKIWSFFFIYGWKFMNFFIVSILIYFKNDILKYDPSKLSNNMKMLLKSDVFDQSFKHIVIKTIEKLS